MFMGPFAFVSWWPLSQRASHYRCGLMNDVAQTLSWHLCVLGRRDAGPIGRVKNESGGGGCTWGRQGWGPVRHQATGRWKPASRPPPPSCHRPSCRPMATRGWSAAMMLSLIPTAVNSALAFQRNIYLHPNRRSRGPSAALQRPRKAAQRVNVPVMNGAAHDFICQADTQVLVFDVLFKCLWLTKVT